MLLTNDDGYDSPGLLALTKAFTSRDPWIVAPDRQRSAVGHGMTIYGDLKIKQYGERYYSCSGTPVDCVVASTLGIMPRKPELVISGINLGPNLGTDSVYSGTVAAARQAALLGIPGIALSKNNNDKSTSFNNEAAWVADNIDRLVSCIQPGTVLSINFPKEWNPYARIVQTKPVKRFYHDKMEIFTYNSRERYFFIKGEGVSHIELDDGDCDICNAGDISISLLEIHPHSRNIPSFDTIFTGGGSGINS